MDNILSNLQGILSQSYEYDFDVLRAVYNYAIASNSGSSTMRYFFEHMPLLGKSVNPDDMNLVDQFTSYYEKYNSLVNGIINRLVHNNSDENEFYQKLWNAIESGSLIDDNATDKTYAWLFVWRNNFIPYFQLDGGVKMSNEDYQALTNQLFLKLSEINFILHSDFDQKTEQSSLLVSVLDSCNSIEEKSVLLAQLLRITHMNQLSADSLRRLKDLFYKTNDES